MDLVNSHQCTILEVAYGLLNQAGLTLHDLEPTYSPLHPTSSLLFCTLTPAVPSIWEPIPAVLSSHYTYHTSRLPIYLRWTQTCWKMESDQQEANCECNHQSSSQCDCWIPSNWLLWWGGCGPHISCRPHHSLNPKASFQYSLGDSYGGYPGVMCNLLCDDAGHPVKCNHLETSCKSNTICHMVMLIVLLDWRSVQHTHMAHKVPHTHIQTSYTFVTSLCLRCPTWTLQKQRFLWRCWHSFVYYRSMVAHPPQYVMMTPNLNLI